MNKIQKRQVGERIKSIRKSRGENQTEFAKKIGATLPAVSNWETGRNIPNNERLKVIADIANISVADLLYGDNDFDLSADKYLFAKLEPYYKENMQIIRTEFKLFGGAIAENLGLKKDGENLDEYNKHRDFYRGFKAYATDYINQNYKDYSYKKFLVDYPDSDLIDFQEFKENEWVKTKKVFDEIIENHKAEFTESNAVWINRQFTSLINEDLTGIKIISSKEGENNNYLEKLIQPILNEAAGEIKTVHKNLKKDKTK